MSWRLSDSFTVHSGACVTWSKDAAFPRTAAFVGYSFLGASSILEPLALDSAYFVMFVILQAHLCGPVSGLDKEWLPLPCANVWNRTIPC